MPHILMIRVVLNNKPSTSGTMHKGILLFLLISTCLFSTTQLSHANVRLPAILGSHMVLQQKSDITLWGWSDAMEKIVIQAEWDTTHYTVTGSRDANWSVVIKTPAAGGPYKITITARNTLVLEDVLIGEVWLCSGQSNMEWNVSGSKQADEAQRANNPAIRFFYVNHVTSDYPQNDLTGNWVVCTPDNAKYFSAVGYFFGRKVNQELNQPVGLICSSWGGTPAEVWTPKELVDADPALKAAAAKISGDYPGWPILPGKTYNAMISPITNFSIAGVLWYQGETNSGTYSTYQQLLTTMIGSWRNVWHKEFPFYYVQIAPYQYGENQTGALMREAQTTVMRYPHTGMVVISDLVDDVKDIHPKNKLDVGLRLANYALGDTYGKQGIAYKSPQYKDMKVEKSKIRISFDNVPNGLKTSGGNPTELYIAGADQKFVPATGKIDGNGLLVWSNEIKNPVAVRFGFSNIATPNLFSKEGLPVNLFRTDNWSVDPIPVKK